MLSDDLRNAHMTLKSANQLHDVDTQGTVNDVINRLPTYCRQEWTKRAMIFRREHSKYPGYQELIAYVEEASADANDPVYGNFVFVHDDSVPHRNKGNCLSLNSSTRPLCPVCYSDRRVFVKMRKDRFAPDRSFNCSYGGLILSTVAVS